MPSEKSARVHPRHGGATWVIYCADCPKCYGKASDIHAGQDVRCEKDDLHICQVVKGPTGMAWLRLESWLFAYETRWTALKLVRKCGFGVGLYHAITILLAMIMLTVLQLISSPVYIIYFAAIFSLIAVYLIVDFILAFTSTAFVSRYPASALRSIVFFVSGFSRYCIAWAILYFFVEAYFKSQFDPTISPFEALYFSFIAVTTTGFGHISPVGDFARFLSVLQIVLGIYLLTVILSLMASWVGQNPSIKTLLSVEEAKTPSVQDSSREEGTDLD